METGCGCLLLLLLIGVGPIGWMILGGIFALILVINLILAFFPSPSPKNNFPVVPTIFLGHAPDDLDNLLMDLSRGGIRDPVTQELFKRGEKIHLCLTHRLAYHEDSWRHLGGKCSICGHSHNTKIYTLP